MGRAWRGDGAARGVGAGVTFVPITPAAEVAGGGDGGSVAAAAEGAAAAVVFVE